MASPPVSDNFFLWPVPNLPPRLFAREEITKPVSCMSLFPIPVYKGPFRPLFLPLLGTMLVFFFKTSALDIWRFFFLFFRVIPFSEPVSFCTGRKLHVPAAGFRLGIRYLPVSPPGFQPPQFTLKSVFPASLPDPLSCRTSLLYYVLRAAFLDPSLRFPP